MVKAPVAPRGGSSSAGCPIFHALSAAAAPHRPRIPTFCSPPPPPSSIPMGGGEGVLAGAGMLLSCSAFMHSWVSAACGCFLAPIPQLGLPLCPPQLAGLGAGGCARAQLPCAGVGGGLGRGKGGGECSARIVLPPLSSVGGTEVSYNFLNKAFDIPAPDLSLRLGGRGWWGAALPRWGWGGFPITPPPHTP